MLLLSLCVLYVGVLPECFVFLYASIFRVLSLILLVSIYDCSVFLYIFMLFVIFC